MKTRKFGLILAAVAVLMAVPMFAATVHADDLCAYEFADSPAASDCTVTDGFWERDAGRNRTWCLFSVSCSVSITHGALGSDGIRPTYELTLDGSNIGVYLRHLSGFDICISQSTGEDDSVSFSGYIATDGCKIDEYTTSEVDDGEFHTTE